MTYQVLESNGVELYLFIFDKNGSVIYGQGGYENCYGRLSAVLDGLRKSCPLLPMEDGLADAAALYKKLSGMKGVWVVADEKGLYLDRMERTAYMEFEMEGYR